MPRNRQEPKHDQGDSFSAAVAQWRLALRTEVKSASALPTAIFHSRDAMLETLLAETNESMLAQLQEPATRLLEPQTGGEQRIETVRPEELRALPAHLREEPDVAVDIDDHLTDEMLAVLVDACSSGEPPAVAGAVEMLRNHFGIDPAAPADVAAVTLRRELDRALVADPGTYAPLAPWSQSLAAIVAANGKGGSDGVGA